MDKSSLEYFEQLMQSHLDAHIANCEGDDCWLLRADPDWHKQIG